MIRGRSLLAALARLVDALRLHGRTEVREAHRVPTAPSFKEAPPAFKEDGRLAHRAARGRAPQGRMVDDLRRSRPQRA